MTEINRILEMSKRSMGKPSRENLKFDELIRDAIAFLIKRGEMKIPRKSNRTLVPILDLAQNRFQIVGDRFFTFAGVLEVSGLWVV